MNFSRWLRERAVRGLKININFNFNFQEWLREPFTNGRAAVLTVAVVVSLAIAGLQVGAVHSTSTRTRQLTRQTHALTERVNQGLVNQVGNRTKNVSVWCGAINQGRDYDRAFVDRATRGALTARQLKYALPDLNCRALERATLRSAGANTEVSQRRP